MGMSRLYDIGIWAWMLVEIDKCTNSRRGLETTLCCQRGDLYWIARPAACATHIGLFRGIARDPCVVRTTSP